MNPKLLLCLALGLSGALSGCADFHSARALDIRSKLLASAKKNDPGFPDGKNLILTHFSHIGELATLRGDIIYVADERGVTSDALSPHGDNYIEFFNAHFQFLGKL